jgi:cytochrome oxidase Cu insertion factor (SCO1/SenC/PrrC family)
MRLRIVALLVVVITSGILGNAQRQTSAFAKIFHSVLSTPVKVGEIAPDFTLEDQDGRKVTLSDARGNKPTVLVFYRGHW